MKIIERENDTNISINNYNQYLNFKNLEKYTYRSNDWNEIDNVCLGNW